MYNHMKRNKNMQLVKVSKQEMPPKMIKVGLKHVYWQPKS